MSTERDISERILVLLRAYSHGLTISEISRYLKIHRNSSSKHLSILLKLGQVEMQEVGASKIYYYSRKIPFGSLLGFTKEGIIVLDTD